MTKGKPWTIEEETQLKTLIEAKKPVDIIAAKLERRPGAIILKCKRLGLEATAAKGSTFTGTISIPKDLPSVETALRILAGALKAAVKPGLNKVEVQRLQTVANISKTYKVLLADYINYREIEIKLNDMEEKYADMEEKYGQLLQEKSKDDAPKPDPAPVEQSPTEPPANPEKPS
jgi:hypothetical protein